ncbi:MAG: alpha/beta hydrolase [Methyloceanibacter sp.]|nr:alpha/beta hydrolase [Methyloceanibacter sp.]
MELIAWGVAIYALICAVVYFANRAFIYFPDPARVVPAQIGLTGVKEVELVTADRVALVGWYAPAQKGKPTILYFHGNASNAANRAPRIAAIAQDGFGLLYLNNRGYGGSGGKPTEKKNTADAITAYDYLVSLGVPADSIVAYGESLGSGQAIALATKRLLAAIVLESPLTSVIDVAKGTYFWLPLNLLIADTYNNEENIRNVRTPVLVLHGQRDGVISVEMGKRLFRAANEPKRIKIFPSGRHVDLFEHGAWEDTKHFLASRSG